MFVREWRKPSSTFLRTMASRSGEGIGRTRSTINISRSDAISPDDWRNHLALTRKRCSACRSSSTVVAGPRVGAEGLVSLELPPSSRLALPLSRAAGLIDLHCNRQRLRAAAISGAANGRCAKIIQADRDARMGVGGANRVRGIEGDPAEIGYERFGPGVTGLLIH